MKIILIGNYPPDKQESMKLFSSMLNEGFTRAGVKSEIWVPTVFFGAWSTSTSRGVGKWLGYLDKWVLYPLILKARLLKKEYRQADTKFHICDHSNSIYLPALPVGRRAITCHDVLAIRGAFGFEDAYCKASRFGLILQKWILRNLVQAEKMAAVSALTLRQLRELSTGITPKQADWRVIHNAFNGQFGPVGRAECIQRIRAMGLSENRPFILHVGSSLDRKNRKLLVDMVTELGPQWNGIVCLAGEGIDTGLAAHIQQLGLQERIRSVIRPDHENLLALYSSCEAFIFPSFSEGFGWPVIEAQACGAPVIASNIEPMPEVSGGAAIHENPLSAAAFAGALLSLQNSTVRRQLIERGFENCSRFSSKTMMEAYLSLHNFKSFHDH